MEFLILGPLEVREGDRPVAIGSGRQRALLALLLLHANEVVSTDRLVDELWGAEPPVTAVKIVQGYVSELRKTLDLHRARGEGEEVLVTHPPGYLLRVGRVCLDARRFEELAADGRRALAAGASGEAATMLREALALWRGDALVDFAVEEFAQAEIRRLEELRLAALEDRIEADLALGRHGELVGELEALAGRHPLRERLRGQLMLALYRSGRQAEALEAYREGRRVLVDELGLEPGEELQRLERAILAHDPSLGAPVPAPRTAAEGASAAASAAPRLRRKRSLAVVLAALAAGGAAFAVVELTGRSASGPVVAAPNSVAVIDPETNRVVGDVPVGTRPVAVAVGHGSVWVANADNGTVSRIDPGTLEVVQTIGIGAPAIDVAIGREAVWVANGSEGTLSRIDPDTGAVVETVDLRGPDELAPNTTSGVAEGADALWVASGERTILGLDPDTGETLAMVDVGDNPVAVEVGEGSVWTATVSERAIRIEPGTGTVTATVPVGLPVTLAVGDGAVWVLDAFDSLWRVDPHAGVVTRTIAVGPSPLGVAVGAGAVWVAVNGDGTVARVRPETGEVAVIPVGHAPTDVAVGEGRVWVSVAAEPAK